MMNLPARRPPRYFVIALIFFLSLVALLAQEAAKPKMEDQTSFDVIGISARTNNTAEMGPNGEIPKLWQRLFGEGIVNQIPDRAGEEIVAVYIAPGKYEEFVTAKGPGQEVVPAAWMKIYTFFQQPSVPPRAYKTDFETYAPSDPANVQGHIFIGVKP
jgi:predicted transcriptional regulator YdeE